MDDAKIKNYMKPQPYIGHRKMTVDQMRGFLKSSKIRHLPILEGDKIVGVVDSCLLKEAAHLIKDMELLAEDIMNPQPLIVPEGTPVKEVAQTMSSLKEDCVLVVDQNGKLKGIFTSVDGMRMLSMVLRTSPDICKGLEAIENYSFPIDIDMGA